MEIEIEWNDRTYTVTYDAWEAEAQTLEHPGLAPGLEVTGVENEKGIAPYLKEEEYEEIEDIVIKELNECAADAMIDAYESRVDEEKYQGYEN